LLKVDWDKGRSYTKNIQEAVAWKGATDDTPSKKIQILKRTVRFWGKLYNAHSSQLSLSSSCALGRCSGSNIQHLLMNAATFGTSSIALSSWRRPSRVVEEKLLVIWRSVPG
jgi:hypothetical protein